VDFGKSGQGCRHSFDSGADALSPLISFRLSNLSFLSILSSADRIYPEPSQTPFFPLPKPFSTPCLPNPQTCFLSPHPETIYMLWGVLWTLPDVASKARPHTYFWCSLSGYFFYHESLKFRWLDIKMNIFIANNVRCTRGLESMWCHVSRPTPGLCRRRWYWTKCRLALLVHC